MSDIRFRSVRACREPAPRAGGCVPTCSKRTGIGIAALLLLAGCGDEQALTPRPGAHLPVKAATAPARPNADQLLAPTAHERPGRSDELLIRSQPRPDDRFDLPPR